MTGELVRWLNSPFHHLLMAFGLPAIAVGAMIGTSAWQAFAGMLGVVAYSIWQLRRWGGDHLKDKSE